MDLRLHESWGEGWKREWQDAKGTSSISAGLVLYTQLTLLHCNVHRAGAGTLQQLLVGLGRLVKQLHEECTGLLILTTPDGRQLVQLLLDQTCILEGVFQAISIPQEEERAL